MEMMECQNLAVPASVMRHVVHVESGANPYAIGVVGGRLERQPKSLDEAVATARMLEEKGFNFSLGLAQVNRSNLGKYGLDTHEKAFDACSNLSAGSHILADCYSRAGGNWGKAFSCYYSGNFVRGFQDGYVQKVYHSMNLGTVVADNGGTAIPLSRQSGRPEQPTTPFKAASSRRSSERDRTAERSSPLNTAALNPPAPATEPAEIDQVDRAQGGHDSAFVF